VKTRNPKSRFNLEIKKDDYVLEVGGGHNPHKKADVVVDKFSSDNYHRSGDIKTYKNQVFIEADGENLPFADNEFDYVICNQVLEHVENPQRFLSELSRISKRGYIETPSLIGEYLFPKKSHRWVLLEIDNKLIMMEKNKTGINPKVEFGDLFLHYLPKKSLGFKILERTYPDLFTVRYEWKNEIECVINPNETRYRKYFLNPWDEKNINSFFSKRSLIKEFILSTKAFINIIFSVITNKIKQQFRLG